MMKTMMEDEAPKKAPTKQKPFNLTKPKPKVIEEPEPMKREVKANPAPKFRKSLAQIEKEKEERRKAKVEAVRRQYESSKE